MREESAADPESTPDSGAGEHEYTLEELLAGVTDENVHPEVDWGPSVGKEVWWSDE